MDGRQGPWAYLVWVSFTAERAASVVARCGSSNVVFRAIFLRVLRRGTSPYVRVLDDLRVSNVIEACFQGVKRVEQRSRFVEVGAFLYVVAAPVRVGNACAPRVENGHVMCYGRELIFFAFEAIVEDHFYTFVPASLVVYDQIVIYLTVVHAVVANVPRPL